MTDDLGDRQGGRTGRQLAQWRSPSWQASEASRSAGNRTPSSAWAASTAAGPAGGANSS
ncbi:hypothetical protein ABZ700_28845 [Streptomyces diastaticus]|uniref:hypothetical protein n=1 Tax=Streptomyces diastaticus TaxID=1956 RepID=UPI0033C43C2E